MNGLMIGAIIVFDSLMACLIVGALCRAGWWPLQKQFPAKPILPEHVRRNFQSFSIGIFNFGWSLHTIVDDDHLHFIPIRLMRWFGCQTVSVPWDEVLDHPQPGKSKYTVLVKIANQTILGPRWCLDCRTTLRSGSR
jgi:hypothetical protein